MASICYSKKSQNPLKNKGFDTRYLFCYLKNHRRKMCAQMHSDALREAFLKHLSLDYMRHKIQDYSKSAVVCLEASVWFSVDTFGGFWHFSTTIDFLYLAHSAPCGLRFFCFHSNRKHSAGNG